MIFIWVSLELSFDPEFGLFAKVIRFGKKSKIDKINKIVKNLENIKKLEIKQRNRKLHKKLN